MKKILLFSFITLAALTSCGSLDINDDPNNPNGSNVSASLIMPSVENYIADVVGDGAYNTTGFLVQYFEQAPVANQYNNLTWYNLTVDDNLTDRYYRNLYAGALKDIDEIMSKTDNMADKFAAQVLRTYSFQVLVDLMGETPYSEALDASITKPKYDNGSDVYVGVLNELDSMENLLDASGDDALSVTDLVADKDLSQWKGFANALRVRMYLRLIQGGIDADTYTSKLKEVVNEGEFFTGNIEYGPFSDEENKSNPWYETNHRQLAANHVGAYPVISYMNATNDPRLAYSFELAAEGDYAGTYAGLLNGTHAQSESGWMFTANDYVSTLKYYPVKPVEFFTQAELQFLLSEVYLKYFNDDAKAKAAYEAGVNADFETRGISGASSFLSGEKVSWDNASSTTDKLNLVYMQKWVALLYMDHVEAWSEQRRTDVPSWGLTAQEVNADVTAYTLGDLIYPWRDDMGTRVCPVRLFYSTEATQLNTNAPEQPTLTTPVFWDK